jgi:hypothetical protein
VIVPLLALFLCAGPASPAPASAPPAVPTATAPAPAAASPEAPIPPPTASTGGAATAPDPGLRDAASRAKASLLARHGGAHRARIERGVDQMALLWRPTDGDDAAFQAFAEGHFLAEDAALAATLSRFEEALEELDGRFLQVNRALSRHAVLDLGPTVPADALFAAFDASAHLTDDLFQARLAFAALLNFPLTTLEERLRLGPSWSRRQWAEARLLGRRGALVGGSDAGLSVRAPASVRQAMARTYAEAQAYVADYNVYAHHLVDAEGRRLFPRGKRLLSHWNLRDEIKASYALPDGLARQRTLQRAMERIAAQEIPRAAVNSPAVDWNPFTNEVRPAPPETVETGARPPAAADPAREPDTRYAHLLALFRAARALDPWSPAAPTAIARKFEVDREIPEARLVAMLEEVLSSPLVPRIARLVERRLGRKLEPFDVWYAGFRPGAALEEARLDALTRQRYPTAEAFAADLPRMLEALGFAPQKARFLADRIAVEPARGSGHALQAALRGDKAHLRTRVGKDGMDYKGYDIAVHELGHNVEQVLSLYGVDHTLLSGVPNNAFTEALAFVFQSRALELLGFPAPTEEARRLEALNDLWMTWEIAGVAMVDVRAWRWMYENPGATPAALREAVVAIAKEVWNRWYAPVLGTRDVPLLAIYSHMVEEPLYLADYPLGHLLAAQVEERIRKAGAVGPEFERMVGIGSVSPDLWMQHAAGEPVSPRALLENARAALEAEERRAGGR